MLHFRKLICPYEVPMSRCLGIFDLSRFSIDYANVSLSILMHIFVPERKDKSLAFVLLYKYYISYTTSYTL